MDLQILPNWCKVLGFIVFIIFLFLDGGDHFLNSFSENVIYENQGILGLLQAFTGGGKVFDLLIILGLLLYLFSKEKTEDDYIKLLRLESYQFTSIALVLLALIFFLFSFTIRFSIENFISVFIILHLTIFSFKKKIDL
jgi:hypothetical protein